MILFPTNISKLKLSKLQRPGTLNQTIPHPKSFQTKESISYSYPPKTNSLRSLEKKIFFHPKKKFLYFPEKIFSHAVRKISSIFLKTFLLLLRKKNKFSIQK